jgi:DMSO/TMAO reductase YedYZ molybdopterin-dependent catalytic subunit
MKKKMRVMSERPLNAETATEQLRSWITANSVFFDRNQGGIPDAPVPLSEWELFIGGEVDQEFSLDLDAILQMPKASVACTLECSGNSRSLLEEKASGNPWTIGGVGNAVWGGVWLKDLLKKAGLKEDAAHVSFQGLDHPLGSSGIQFIRSIPLQKALDGTLLAYEMNGEPLPLKHGYPLRAVALGWTGANCVKWLSRIMVLDRPYAGFYMDSVYRVFQKGEEPASGTVVTNIKLKSIITQPLNGEELPLEPLTVLGAAYGGEAGIEMVEVSTDQGRTWSPADLIGPDEPFAWRHWQFVWKVKERGSHTIVAKATDAEGRTQPMRGQWNVLGYGNNGILNHAVTVHIT